MTADFQRQIEGLRGEIDALDARIVDLMNERSRLALRIGSIKAENGQPVHVPERERSVLDNIAARNRGPLSQGALECVYRELMAAARDLEAGCGAPPGGSAIVHAAKPWVSRLATYQPGRPIEEVARELGLGDPAGIVKLASNENPLGPSPRAIAAMLDAASKMHIYPDGDSYYLRQALARRLDVPAASVFLGHGSNEILALLGHVYLERGTSIVVSQKAFVVYKLVASLYEAETIETPTTADFGHDLAAMRRAIRSDTRLVFVANPNNPTGSLVAPAELDAFLDDLPPHVVAVIDEAYVELLPEAKRPDLLGRVREGHSIYVLRTFSKAYGLAGLRIGYAIAPPAGIDLLNRVRQPFNVNAMAQAAALAALDDDAHVDATRRVTEDGLRQVEAGLAELGLAWVPSVANFLLVKVSDGRGICGALQRRRVIARPVDAYGLPEYLRVSIGTADENTRFLAALRDVLAERSKNA